VERWYYAARLAKDMLVAYGFFCSYEFGGVLAAINKRIMPNHAERPAPTLAVSLVMGYLGSSRRRFESFRPHQIQFGCLCDRRARIQVSNLPDAKMILQAK
jgi:hypothetical protein